MSDINIPKGNILTGAFDTLPNESVAVNGPGLFKPTLFGDNGNTTVNTDVIGKGLFLLGEGANLTFAGSVSHGTEAYLNLGATITIDHPHEFRGEIGFAQQTTPQNAPFGEFVDLVGLANADSWSMHNDLLSIHNASGKTIDTIRLDGTTPTSVVTDAGSVYLTWGYGAYRVPGGILDAVPLHHIA